MSCHANSEIKSALAQDSLRNACDSMCNAYFQKTRTFGYCMRVTYIESRYGFVFAVLPIFVLIIRQQ